MLFIVFLSKNLLLTFLFWNDIFFFTNRELLSILKQFIYIVLTSLVLVIIELNYHPQFTIPSSFKLERRGNAVKLFRRTDRNGYKEYLQTIDLSAGAKLVFLLEPTIDTKRGLPDPTFERNDLSSIWSRFKTQYADAFSLSSGAFFGWYTKNTARLPFPIKINNKIKSCGFGDNGYDKMLLMINQKSAVIRAYQNTSNVYDDLVKQLPRSPNVLVGLHPRCNKDNLGDQIVGRTYIGLKDSPKSGSTRGDGIHETVLLYHGYCTEKQAHKALLDCGASQIMMLCGGSVTQLVCQDKFYIKTKEKLPQTIGVLEATSFAQH